MPRSINALILLIFLCCAAACSSGDAKKDYECLHWFPAQGKPIGVMLVTHGLNLRPSKMEELAQRYSEAGYEVLRPSFTGHCREPDELKEVRPSAWEKDAREFYSLAQKKAEQLKVPLYLTAYSFSGLVYHSMRKELPFKKRVYLAPALETKFWYPFAIFLIDFVPSFTFRTQIPAGYYAQEYSGFRSVLAMNHFLLQWQKNESEPDDSPVLVWAHPGDELVSASGLQEIATKRKWDFRELSIEGCGLSSCYKHLIVDSGALGKPEFDRLVKGSLEFLVKP